MAIFLFAGLLLGFALTATSEPSTIPEHLQEGRQLSGDQAAALEERLERNPHDEDARIKLIAYYDTAHYDDRASSRRHGEHVLWMVRHKPRSEFLRAHYANILPHRNPDAYVDAKRAWLAHVENAPNDAALLATVAGFLWANVDGDLAVSLMERAIEAEPDNAEWSNRLGHLLWSDRSKGDEPDPDAAKALPHFERAYRLARSNFARATYLTPVIRTAFAAHRFDTARAYADEALPVTNPKNMGDLHHHANLVLGRIALVEGDVERAGDHLLAAADTQGSPPMRSFGPNMRLAKELLELGHHDIVLEYLKRCAEFWPDPKLDVWTVQVRSGQTPNFMANLFY